MPGKILVADDDSDNRIIATETLEAYGYTVFQAVNGLEVLEWVQKETLDLILLDLSMPKMDGWEAFRKLKELDPTRGIRVIAFTAHAMRGDSEKVKLAGFDDYLTKPCIPKKIEEKVREWLDKKTGEK